MLTKSFQKLCLYLCLLAGTVAGRADNPVTINVAINDLGALTNSTTADLRNAITENVKAGIWEWTQFLVIPNRRSIEVVVRFDPTISRGSGRSLSMALVRRENGIGIYEQGVAAELRDGVDRNGNDYDVEFNLNPTFLASLWFDPVPTARTNAMPDNHVDAVSFFAHEFGHALAFNGWKDTVTGKLKGNFQSRWDCHAQFDGTNWFFHGKHAQMVWGQAVPLSRINNNYQHSGNPTGANAPGADSTLQKGLMNGVNFQCGTRYYVNLLDVAMIKDAGLQVLPSISFVRETNYAAAYQSASYHN